MTWQESRTWADTGATLRVRKSGVVKIRDIDTEIKKALIEEAYTAGTKMGLEVFCEDEASPFQAIPQHGPGWQPETKAKCLPHEYVRGGTAKLLTILYPATGQVVVKGGEGCTNAVLHPWLRSKFERILKSIPDPKDRLSQMEGAQVGLPQDDRVAARRIRARLARVFLGSKGLLIL